MKNERAFSILDIHGVIWQGGGYGEGSMECEFVRFGYESNIFKMQKNKAGKE